MLEQLKLGDTLPLNKFTSSASPRCHSDSRHPSIQKLDDIFSGAHLWTIVSEGKVTTEQCVKINLHRTFRLLQIELAASTFFRPLCAGSSIISTEYYLVTSEHMVHLQICCCPTRRDERPSQWLYYSLTALLRQRVLCPSRSPLEKKVLLCQVSDIEEVWSWLAFSRLAREISHQTVFFPRGLWRNHFPILHWVPRGWDPSVVFSKLRFFTLD